MIGRRQRLLMTRAKARAALSHPDLPQEIREIYKRAFDKADAALGLLDAQVRAIVRRPAI